MDKIKNDFPAVWMVKEEDAVTLERYMHQIDEYMANKYKNMKPWYTKLSKTASLMILAFVLVYVTLLKFGDVNWSMLDASIILLSLSISSMLGNLEYR